ncbi:MAG: hypothetical protein Q8Q23_04535 [bacterium]|nr:hypothetical protein [bacterium]
MKKFQGVKIFIFLFIISVLASGCGVSFKSPSAQSNVTLTNGGIYKSVDFGNTWKQVSLINTVSPNIPTFTSGNITVLAIDPNDDNAFYAGINQGGLIYTYDGAQSWTTATSLKKITINDIVVSHENKCVIFVASTNKIYKSVDCARTWHQTYNDNDPATKINTITVDPTNSAIVYAGTSRSELLESKDSGKSWIAKYRFDIPANRTSRSGMGSTVVNRILVNPRNTKNLWVSTEGDAIYRSLDGGASWKHYRDDFFEINPQAVRIRDMAIAQIDGRTIIVATDAGILKSADLGESWDNVALIPPSQRTPINKIAMAVFDTNVIYYVTDTTLGVSRNGGRTWESKVLPSERKGSALVLDSHNSNIVYLGVFLLEEKK